MDYYKKLSSNFSAGFWKAFFRNSSKNTSWNLCRCYFCGLSESFSWNSSWSFPKNVSKNRPVVLVRVFNEFLKNFFSGIPSRAFDGILPAFPALIYPLFSSEIHPEFQRLIQEFFLVFLFEILIHLQGAPFGIAAELLIQTFLVKIFCF